MATETPRRAVLIALSLSALSLCVWVVFIGSWSRPIERRVSNVALSRTGKWLAAGTSQGKITVWDQRREVLLLGRDHFGKKPLYYSWDGRRLLFGSEIKALLADPGLAPAIVEHRRVGDEIEAGALRWGDIDWAHNTFRICKGIYR